MIRNFATFRSDFPDDSIEAEGETVTPGGHGLMNLIRAAFQRSKHEVTGIEQHSYYGWSFHVMTRGGGFRLMIQYPGPWLLTILDSRPFWKRLFAGKPDFERFVNESRLILRSVPEAGEICWFSKLEWEEVAWNRESQSDRTWPDNARGSWSPARMFVAVVVWMLVASGTGILSLYGSFFLVKALVFHGRVSSWGWEYLGIMYAPLIGLAAYIVHFAFLAHVTFPRRCLLSAVTGCVVSWIAMLLYHGVKRVFAL